ncbi:hypothetical protein Tcan_03882 [Toxocara canis]|uniref:Uncharacterized protein n=1 Tax=Toxocara canis TaxID=6265 RepID=A0A0B2UWI6_TOXCA|nr:hypothetical protein Tcan_03882 [Toxocara canis]
MMKGGDGSSMEDSYAQVAMEEVQKENDTRPTQPEQRVFSRESPNAKHLEKSMVHVLIISPLVLKPHLCCLGYISIHDAVFMIGTCELFIIALLALYFAPTVLNDGYLFFTTELEGYGNELGYLFVIGLFFSILVVVLLLIGAMYRSKLLLIPHIVWQITVLIIYGLLIYSVTIRIEMVSYKPSRNKIPFPSAIVIIIVLLTASLIDVWWTAIVVDAVFRMRKKSVKTSTDKVEETEEH